MKTKKQLEAKIETLTADIDNATYPMIWSYCQVESERIRINNLILKKMMNMVHPNIDMVLNMIETQLNSQQ